MKSHDIGSLVEQAEESDW